MIHYKKKILAIYDEPNCELKEIQIATLNLLEVIKKENEAREKTEESLRKSEEKYRLLINTANESVIVVQDGLVKFVNPMTLALLEVVSEQELIDRPISEFIHPDDQGVVLENYRLRTANVAIPPRYDFRIVTCAGIVRWVEINVAMIDWQGKPATLNLITDITERKKFELEVRAANEQLELLNQDRKSVV